MYCFLSHEKIRTQSLVHTSPIILTGALIRLVPLWPRSFQQGCSRALSAWTGNHIPYLVKVRSWESSSGSVSSRLIILGHSPFCRVFSLCTWSFRQLRSIQSVYSSMFFFFRAWKKATRRAVTGCEWICNLILHIHFVYISIPFFLIYISIPSYTVHFKSLMCFGQWRMLTRLMRFFLLSNHLWVLLNDVCRLVCLFCCGNVGAQHTQRTLAVHYVLIIMPSCITTYTENRSCVLSLFYTENGSRVLSLSCNL